MAGDHGLLHLVRIYGEIDRKIKADPDLAAEVSFLLPAYAEAAGADVHWFDDFEVWLRELVTDQRGDPDTAVPSLEEAVKHLGELEPQGRMRARRLHLAGAAARTLPELSPGELTAAALGPLFFERVDDPVVAAEQFVRLLRRDPEGIEEALSPLDLWWQQVLAWHLLEAAGEIGPPPCSGRLVWLDIDGNREPVPTLVTVFEADLSFEAAKRFCDPTRWPCFAFWCDMRDLEPHKGPFKPDGVRRYEEAVSLDCPNHASWLYVELAFRFIEDPVPPTPRVATTEYELARPHPHIAVNEGTLEVVELSTDPPRVRVTSTKRLKFKGTFDGPAFASILCLVGYLGYVEDLLTCAADENWEAGFPGRVPDKGAQKGSADPDPYFPGLTKYVIDRVATALDDCLDEYSKTPKAPPGKRPGPSRGAGMPAQHMAETYSRMLKEGAKLADLGLRGARMAPGGPPRSGSCGPQSTAGEVIEDWTQLGKLLIRKWSTHAGQVANKLDNPSVYKADTMAADLATTALLAIETTARVTWETLDSATILCGGPARPYIVESDEFKTGLEQAALTLLGDLERGLGGKLPESAVLILPMQSGPGETRFKLRVDATLRRSGTYRGWVQASAGGQVEQVRVRVMVP